MKALANISALVIGLAIGLFAAYQLAGALS